MIQEIRETRKVDVGTSTTLRQVKVGKLQDGDGKSVVNRHFDVSVENIEGSLAITLTDVADKGTHSIHIEEGHINVSRVVKNMDPTMLDKQDSVEWLKSDGTWGPEPVKTKRLNAPFTFHMRDIKAQ